MDPAVVKGHSQASPCDQGQAGSSQSGVLCKQREEPVETGGEGAECF